MRCFPNQNTALDGGDRNQRIGLGTQSYAQSVTRENLHLTPKDME